MAQRKRQYGKAMKRLVFKLAGGACEYCGQLVEIETSTIDHVDPVGADDVENYRLACLSCNSRKTTKSLEEFRCCLAVRSAFTECEFSYNQAHWLVQQDWFPVNGDEYTFHFELT